MFYLTLIVASQAEEECKFDLIHYDIKLLTIAQSNGLDVGSRTSEVFLFGTCKNLALLELAGGEFTVFDLDAETGKNIRLLSRNEDDVDLLKRDLRRQEFWTDILVKLEGQLPIKKDYELRAVRNNGISYLLSISSSDRRAVIVSATHFSEVPLFVASRVNEERFMQQLIDLGLELEGSGSELEVAGDNGFIFLGDVGRTFVEYGSVERHKLCDYNDILDRAKKFPIGVTLDSFIVGDEEEKRFIIAVANHVNRSKYTAISFGC